MSTVSGFDYAEIQFDKSASVVERAGYDQLLEAVGSGQFDDVIVLAHGWNSDLNDARSLYRGLAAQLSQVRSDVANELGLSSRVALVWLLWPSLKFADSDLIPGGAAAVAAPVSDDALRGQLDQLKGGFEALGADAQLVALQALVPHLENSPSACDAFVDGVRSLLPDDAGTDPDDFPQQFTTLPGRDVLDKLSAPILATDPGSVSQGGAATGSVGAVTASPADAAGAAALLGFSLGGIKAAAQRLLNLTTYYEMKARAGAVGAAAAAVFAELPAKHAEVRVHLVGHSFGARLVTSCAFSADGWHPRSVSLLQAAFSHYSFAQDYEGSADGFFRGMVTLSKVTGPVIVTHSDKDLAVGLAYPLASRLAQQVASALGDANDLYGGLGRNGAQKTPEAVQLTLQAAGTSYTLESGAVYNLRADDVIMGHLDIVRPEVAYAIWSVVAVTQGA